MMLYLLAFASTLTAQIRPTRLSPYFDQDQFAECVAEAFSRAYDPSALRAKLLAVDARRTALSEPTRGECKEFVRLVCEDANLPLPRRIQGWLKPLGCAAERRMAKSLTNHSTALIDCVPAPARREPNEFQKVTLWEFEHRDVNVNQMTNLGAAVLGIGAPPAYAADYEGPEPPDECLNRKADPLVRWLLERTYHSVSHPELFARATQIYGDPLTALAVIGQLFDSERQVCASRSRGCVLGNRMRPMFAAGQPKYVNPVGENYHFWAQLNAALTESVTQEKIANYALEWLKDGDSGEYSANAIGLDAGAAAVRRARDLLAHVGPRPPRQTCRLP